MFTWDEISQGGIIGLTVHEQLQASGTFGTARGGSARFSVGSTSLLMLCVRQQSGVDICT